jgi:hypothetical protein
MKKMSNWLNKNGFSKNDELYTPEILVKPIIKYLRPGSSIWCPFDTEKSEFVITLSNSGFRVIHSHIWEGKDFFNYEPHERYDYIISNPPFSLKLEVLDRLYGLNKPFAVLLGLPILNYQAVGEFFLDKKLQLLIVDKKVSFDGNTSSFNTSYFCNNILPQDIIFEHLENNNSNKHFRRSSMVKKILIEKTKDSENNLSIANINRVELSLTIEKVKSPSIIDSRRESCKAA